MQFFITLFLCYLVGAIPTGVLLTRLTGKEDIRQAGSGNIGATNVYRVAGKKLGILTLIGDVLKGLLPTLYILNSSLYGTQQALCVAAVFLGHCYPVFLKFKGGKGVATALGIYLVASPISVVLILLVFAGVLWQWRYVSAASIAAAVVIPIFYFWLKPFSLLFVTLVFISYMVVYRHQGNIERLRNGTENKFSF